MGATSVEMEAPAAVQMGLLTIDDMYKAADRGMGMENVGLLEERGANWGGGWAALQ